jgi:aminodeoxyfutalosine deaminase
MPSRQTLHARYVYPVVGEPIENGFVSVEEGRIIAVGKSSSPEESFDLGNVAILPGLINAHTHLEFSGLSEPLGSPGMGFVDWIREVIAWRRDQLLDSPASVAAGLQECSRHGVTTVGNISQPEEPEDAYEHSSADGIRFAEFIAPNMSDPLLRDLPCRRKAKIAATWRFGLSPHAPYSVHPILLEHLIGLSVGRDVPLAMHVAESREELQLLERGDGPFRDFLAERHLFDPASFPGGKRPLDYLKLLARAPRALVVHGNYLGDEEIAFLANNASRMAVIYCPRTHAFFRHDRYPLEKMLAAGVTVALSTDSRASSPDLSLLSEMRFVAKHFPQVNRERVLAFGTIDAARAMGRADEIGSLEAGKTANLAVVALPDGNGGDPYRLLLESDGRVVQTWFRGCPVTQAPHIN